MLFSPLRTVNGKWIPPNLPEKRKKETIVEEEKKKIKPTIRHSLSPSSSSIQFGNNNTINNSFNSSFVFSSSSTPPFKELRKNQSRITINNQNNIGKPKNEINYVDVSFYK